MPSTIHWELKRFEELTVQELYTLLRLREQVFILEQTCLYDDLDNRDQEAWHLLLFDKQEMVGYARIFPPNTLFPQRVSFGRVLLLPSHRGGHLGDVLVTKIVDTIETHFKGYPIQISAQAHLQAFYEKHGFSPTSEVYLDAGVAHLDMVRKIL